MSFINGPAFVGKHKLIWI